MRFYSLGQPATLIDHFNEAGILQHFIDHPSQPHPSSHLSHTSPLVFSLPFKDISATAQQIDVRAAHIHFLIKRYHSLRSSHLPIAEYSAKYVSFYNTLWLILNDLILGTAFGSFLCENHLVLSDLLHSAVQTVLIDWIQFALLWLNNWPAGLKLNTELSRFYSHTFISLLITWGSLLQIAAPYLPSILYLIGIMSSCGMTAALSLLSDFLALLTLHLYLCYQISRLVYHQQLKMARSLWNLFRGKRYNVLRNRIDPWDYDMDQLLFGTMLFTLLAFLFPTVLAYYSLFAILRYFTILFQAGIETMLAFMNHFPLFALTLRVKDPWRLPGGIYFVTSFRNHRPVLVIKSQPVPLSSIFSQYIALWSHLSSHYNPIRLLLCVFSGEALTAIPKHSIRLS